MLRPDHEEAVGGDLVQLRATVAAVRSCGIDAVAATRADAPQHADVVHLYNLQLPSLLASDVEWARDRWPRAKVAVSPVFWPLALRPVLATGDPMLWFRWLRREGKARLTWRRCRDILETADAIFPNSAIELRSTARYFGIRDTDRWAPVPNGIWVDDWPLQRATLGEREEWLARIGIQPTVERVVACVARLETLKNQRALVKAVAGMSECALVLVGPIGVGLGERQYAEATLRSARTVLPGRFAWLGRQDHGETRRILRRVDVHVLPSFRETPGIASLEAGATGCEIVVTREGSTEEYFGRDAHFTDPQRSSSIAAAIREAARLPRQPALRSRIEGFDWSRAGQVLADHYRSLV